MPQLIQNADASLGIQGTDLDQGAFILKPMFWNANSNSAGTFLAVSGFITPRRMIVKSIQYVNDTAATNAVTLTVFRAPSGTAIGSGTALHSSTANLQLAANTVANLAISSAAAADLPAGTRVGFVISAAPGAAGVGTITLTLAPA